MKTEEEIRKEIICELERSIMVSKNKDGSASVDLGNGAIRFTIYTSLLSMWRE